MPAKASSAAVATVTISVPYCFQNCFSSAICSCSSRSNAMSESSMVVESRFVRFEDGGGRLFRIHLQLCAGFAQRLEGNDLPARFVITDDHGVARPARIGPFHLRLEIAAAAVKHDGKTAPA